MTPLPSPREKPLADLPVEIELHGCPNLCRHDGDDLLNLLRGYALLGGLNHQHFGGFRYSDAGHARRASGRASSGKR
jgi:hypothetical protein